MKTVKKIVLLAALVSAAVMQAEANRAGEMPKSVSVLYLGDSLTDYDRGSNHVDRLQASLDRKWPGKVRIHNFAVRGDYIERVMDRMNSKRGTSGLNRYKGIWDNRYDWAFVSLGHNDTRTRKNTGFTVPHMSEAQLRDGFSALISLLKAKGVKRIILLSAASCNFEAIREKQRSELPPSRPERQRINPLPSLAIPSCLKHTIQS